MSLSPTAPHLVEPELAHVTTEGLEDYLRAVARGFQEPFHDETPELDRKLFLPERTFGFKVGDRWVATNADFERRLTVPGGAAVPTAAVTVVTVHPPYHRRGLLTAMMHHQLQQIADRGEPLAALWASESMIYGRYGYGPATSRATLNGSTRQLAFLPEVRLGGSVDEVDRTLFLEVAGKLHDCLVVDRPGAMVRGELEWEFAVFDEEFARDGASELRYLLHYDESGEPDGFGLYRYKEHFDEDPKSEIRIKELWADDPVAYASLWRYLLDLDLVRTFRMRNAPVDEPLRLLTENARGVRTGITDNLYLRVVDVEAALRARRYDAPVDVVLEVTDPILETNTGCYRLRASDDAVVVERVAALPDLSMGILELGTIYLGGVPLAELHRVRRVTEHTAGAVNAASRAFGWHRAPWCPDSF